MASDICVAHLVRKKNGLEPFRHFLESYLANPAGIEHDLLIIYKGFDRNEEDIAPYEELLQSVPHSFLRVADFGFDLRPYFIAAKKVDSEYLCLLNSFCVILDEDWLLKLHRHIRQPGVGLVGATGSWGSFSKGSRAIKECPFYERLARHLARRLLAIFFDCFPNYHIRTNGFMIARKTMLKIKHGMVLTKMHAWLLESGRNGITKQIERMGLEPVVVGKDGKSYSKHEWSKSDTFWHGTQGNLLISDNQTRMFDTASLERRQKYGLFAWGELPSKSQSEAADS
jgi:hypothetical protein